MLFQKMRFLLFLSIVWLGLSSCSENDVNGLPGAPEDTVDPSISYNYPELDQEEVEVDEYVRIVFSELMDETSLLAGGIQLFSGEEDDASGEIEELRESSLEFSEVPSTRLHPVTGEREESLATVLRLQAPKKRLALGTTYTVRVFDSAKDLAGNPKIDEDEDEVEKETFLKLTFSVEDGIWQDAYLLETTIPDPVNPANLPVDLTGDVFDPKLASNSEGDTIAVWRQAEVNNGATRIAVSRYSANDAGWGSVETQSIHTASADFIDQGLETSAFAPEVAVNKNGVAAVVWHQSPVTGGIASIYINVFDCGNWLGPTNILSGVQQAGEIASSPKVIVDDNGNIIVAWRELDNSNNNGYYRIKAAPFLIDRVIDSQNQKTCNVTGLSDEQTLVSDASGSADLPQMEISPQGTVFLAWPQVAASSAYQQIYASRYDKDAGWDVAGRIDARNLDVDEQGDASAVSIAIDENNDAFAIWQQYDGKRENIWINRYSGGAWGSAKLFETDNRGDAIMPHISFNKYNEAFAVWHQDQGGTTVLNIKSFMKDNEQAEYGWSGVEELATSSSRIFSQPKVKFDREGNAMAMWVLGNASSGTVAASRYSKEREKWLLVTSMNTFSRSSQGVVFEPLLEDGRMLALWYYFDGSGFKLASALFSE